MAYLTTKAKIETFANIIKLLPENGEFVLLLEEGEIKDLQGETLGSFSVALFDKVHEVEITENGIEIIAPQHNSLESKKD